MNKDNTVKEFDIFQFKIPHELWKQFKIKTITSDRGSMASALIDLIKKDVRG